MQIQINPTTQNPHITNYYAACVPGLNISTVTINSTTFKIRFLYKKKEYFLIKKEKTC